MQIIFLILSSNQKIVRNAVDIDGLTCFDYALLCDVSPQIINLLKKHGCENGSGMKSLQARTLLSEANTMSSSVNKNESDFGLKQFQDSI